MNVGIPRERRPFEYRVGLPPAGVHMFVEQGHKVYVEHGAGEGAGFTDGDYAQSGAQITYSAEEVYGRADLLLKFSRPLAGEIELMRPGLTLAGFLHLAASRQEKVDLMLARKISAIAYEQIEDAGGYRPVLAPLSQIGGYMAVQIAARLMQNDLGGRGILLGGIAGVPPAEVVIVGGGTVGRTAAPALSRAGAHVTILDIDLRQLQALNDMMPGTFVTMLSTPHNLARACAFADVVIGAVLVPGERAPIVITREMVSRMKPRSLIIDMSIDQGGCVETSRPTTHDSPTFVAEGVVHYCVPNMSGVLGRTATHALFNGAYPFLEAIASKGLEAAIESSTALERGLSIYQGEIHRLKPLGGDAG
jgi:alanine dehydrogenase